jgi:usherin
MTMSFTGIAAADVRVPDVAASVAGLLTHVAADGVTVEVTGSARRRRSENASAVVDISATVNDDEAPLTVEEMEQMIANDFLLAALQQQNAALYRDVSIALLSGPQASEVTTPMTSTTSTSTSAATTPFVITTPDFGAVEVLYTGKDRSVTLDSLAPGAIYELRVVAESSGGSAAGNWTRVRTADAAPEGIFRPTLAVENATAIRAHAEAPRIANGDITAYRFYVDDKVAAVVEGTAQPPLVTLGQLDPDTVYSVHVEVCTSAGCSKGLPARIRTAQGVPGGVQPPALQPLSAASVRATWSAPSSPNGVLSLYRLWRRATSLCANGCPPVLLTFGSAAFTFTDTGLEPNTTYEYQTEVSNGAGSTRSAWAPVATLPAQLPAPTVIPLGNTSIEVSWVVPPADQFGEVRFYVLRRDGEVIFNGTRTSFEDTGLVPGTAYTYTLRTATQTTATESREAQASTFVSVPSGFAQPTCTAATPRSVNVTWTPPQQPNGEIVRYEVRRDNEAVISKGLALSHVESGLVPYGLYSFRAFACTSAGCRASPACELRLPEDAPAGLAAPVAAQTVPISGSTATLSASWELPSEPNGVIVSYELQIAPAARRNDGLEDLDSLTWTTRYEGLDTTATVGVQSSVQYAVRVVAANSHSSVTSAPLAISFDVPGQAGASVVVGLPLSTEVQLAWPAASGFVALYEVFIVRAKADGSASTDAPLSLAATSGTSTALLSKLAPQTTYRVRIDAVNAAGRNEGVETTFVTAAQTPVPENFGLPTVAAASATVATVAWEAPGIPHGTIEEYRVGRLSESVLADELSAGRNVSAVRGEVVFRGAQRSFVDRNLMPAASYYYYIEAVNQGGVARATEGSGEFLVQLTMPEATPVGLADPVIDVLTSSTVNVTWGAPSAPNGAILAYRLEGRQVTSPPLQPQLVLSGLQRSFEATNLNAYTLYEYRVSAVNR